MLRYTHTQNCSTAMVVVLLIVIYIMDTTKNYNFEKYFLVLSNLQRYSMVCCCGMWNHFGTYYTADETATTTDEEDQ
jgi:hypothetical protein